MAGLGVEAGGGLIEEQQLGAADDGQSDIEAATTPSGQARGAGAGVVGESHAIDGLGDVGGPSEKTSDVADGLGDSEVLEVRGGLRDDADAGAPGARGAPGVLPQDGDGAAAATAQTLEDLDDGGLAGTVWPQERKDSAGRNREVQVLQDALVPVGLVQAADLDGGELRHASSV